MLIVGAVELILYAVIIWFVLTQIVIPVWFGLPLFPKFSKVGKVESKLKEVSEEVTVGELEEEVNKLSEKIKGKK